MHALRVERQADGWYLLLDGEQIGLAPRLHPRPAKEIRISVRGEAAEFGDLLITELL